MVSATDRGRCFTFLGGLKGVTHLTHGLTSSETGATWGVCHPYYSHLLPSPENNSDTCTSVTLKRCWAWKNPAAAGCRASALRDNEIQLTRQVKGAILHTCNVTHGVRIQTSAPPVVRASNDLGLPLREESGTSGSARGKEWPEKAFGTAWGQHGLR